MGKCLICLTLSSLLLGFLILSWSGQPAAMQGTATVSGVVRDADGPVGGAIVRQQTTATSTISAADGSFTLNGVSEGISVTITAWAEGYYPGGVEVVPPQAGVTITLKHHPADDNPDHEWYTSLPDPEKPIGCGHCMVAFPQWVENAHSQSGVNPRFFSLYNGTDVSGTLHLGGGYKDDFPGTAGNCATCHAPGAAANEPFTADMNELTGVETEGVFCDFCHKIADVYLNPATGLPYSNAPGVTSIRLNRPPSDTHMFYGPFDDVTRRVSYLELEKKSQFCAPCHQFSFWGTPIYESFREWLESPYPAQGVECQTCHMAPTGVDYFVYPEKGGLIRNPDLIASHLQPGAADEELLRNTVTMTLSVRQVANRLRVTVTITNTGAGHHVPTDHPGRHLILTVEAVPAFAQDVGATPAVAQGQGQALPLQDGPTVPDWGGAEAGLPGTAYAKILADAVSGESPVVSYWKPTRIVSDTRVPALGTARSTYLFALPAETRPDTVTVTARLRFRRVFQAVMETRGWDVPDILMEEAEVALPISPWWTLYLPLTIKQ